MLTVTTPAESHRLTTLATVKAELSLTGGSGDDSYLAELIDRASDMVSRHCNRSFAREAVLETFRLAVPERVLSLGRWPLANILSVTENGDTLTADDYEAETETGFLHRLADDRRTLWATGKIEVSYRAGYALPGQPGRTLPPDAEAAVVALVKDFWFARGRDLAVKAETVEGLGRTDYWRGGDSSMPPEVAGLLTPYRNIPVG